MNKSENDYYNQKIENELKKKELEQKYGAHFSQGSNLPTEIENEWLSNIEKFEQQFNNSETISVFKAIGEPAFKRIEELKPNEISFELQSLFDLMNKNDIILDTLCEVEEKELYRFITEELFEYKIENIRIEGMNTCFIYEDFYPNALLDIEQAYDYFFRMTMAKMKNIGGPGYDLLYIDTKNYQDINGEKLEEEKVINKLNQLLDSFDYFKIISNEIDEVQTNKDKTDAKLTCNIHYVGCFANTPETITFKGNGVFRLKPSEYGGWNIYHINIPGFQI
jgi:hypothetical protein